MFEPAGEQPVYSGRGSVHPSRAAKQCAKFRGAISQRKPPFSRSRAERQIGGLGPRRGHSECVAARTAVARGQWRKSSATRAKTSSADRTVAGGGIVVRHVAHANHFLRRAGPDQRNDPSDHRPPKEQVYEEDAESVGLVTGQNRGQEVEEKQAEQSQHGALRLSVGPTGLCLSLRGKTFLTFVPYLKIRKSAAFCFVAFPHFDPSRNKPIAKTASERTARTWCWVSSRRPRVPLRLRPWPATRRIFACVQPGPCRI